MASTALVDLNVGGTVYTVLCVAGNGKWVAIKQQSGWIGRAVGTNHVAFYESTLT
jgi:hypothetical protein